MEIKDGFIEDSPLFLHNKNPVAWEHDKLSEDLSLAIGPTPYLDVPLGSVWLGIRRQENARTYELTEGRFGIDPGNEITSTQRADVVLIKPSYNRFCMSIYEVKISRADFLSDIRTGKWKGYLPHCHRLYFATPSGMVTKEEIPAEAGWIVRGAHGWKVMKAGTPRDLDIPEETLLSLLFSKQRQILRERKINRILGKYRTKYPNRESATKIFGKDLGEAWGNREEYHNLKGIYEDRVETLKQHIQEGLGIEDGQYKLEMVELRNLVRKIKEKAEQE